MTAQERVKIMNDVLVKMEDIKNSQQSLIEKLGHVAVDLFEIKSEALDKRLDKVTTHANTSFEIILEALEEFEMKRNRLENES